MAFRRSLAIRSTLVARRLQPSFGYILSHNDDDQQQTSFQQTPVEQTRRSFHHQKSFSNSVFSQDVRRCSHLSLSSASVFSFSRYMSTVIGGETENVKVISDVAEVITDATMEAVSQAPAVNEVAIAASDSYFPVAALQHVIDMVHTATGFNWWASIIVTTILIRGLTVPLLINQIKATTKLTILRPRMEELREEMNNKGMDPAAVAEGQKQMSKLFKEHGVSPFTPLKGLFIQGPVFISFFLAIRNMAEKVPSFQSGGIYWFTDLTTPDALYIFPVITGLTFWITVELNAQEGMEGNPSAGLIKNISRGFAVLSVPLTMSFPKAIFCYWVTSNLFSLVYGLVIKRPGVKKVLGIPDLPVPPPGSASQQPSFDFSSLLKQFKSMTQRPSSTASTQLPKTSNQKMSSSSLAISQRLKLLEHKVKGKKKNKKR